MWKGVGTTSAKGGYDGETQVGGGHGTSGRHGGRSWVAYEHGHGRGHGHTCIWRAGMTMGAYGHGHKGTRTYRYKDIWGWVDPRY